MNPNMVPRPSFHLPFLQDLLETRELLEEVLEGKQRVEDQLRMRERELTALKGALKEEVASHDQEVEHVRLQYQRDTEQLRRSMQDATQACDKNWGGRGRHCQGMGLPYSCIFELFMIVIRDLPKGHMRWLGNFPEQRGVTG